MSKLDRIFIEDGRILAMDGIKKEIKALMLELIGDVEHRETEDMSLSSWTHEDYKAFGKNELKVELRKKVEEL